MKTTNATPRVDRLVTAILIALSVVPAAAGIARLAQLAGGVAMTASNARFFAKPLPVVMHIVTVIPFSIIGAFQFAPSFRRRHPKWHRLAGRVLGVCGLIVALSGLWMTLVYPWPAGDGALLYVFRVMFGSAMLASIVLGLDAVRRRDFTAHGAWMIRAYAIGMGAGTQVLTHLPWILLLGTPSVFTRAMLMAAGWVINVIVAEGLIRKCEWLPRGTRDSAVGARWTATAGATSPRVAA